MLSCKKNVMLRPVHLTLTLTIKVANYDHDKFTSPLSSAAFLVFLYRSFIVTPCR